MEENEVSLRNYRSSSNKMNPVELLDLHVKFGGLGFSYDLPFDARLRCDLVDLYFILFGNKKPSCLMDESQENLSEEISSRRKSPIVVREEILEFEQVPQQIVRLLHQFCKTCK